MSFIAGCRIGFVIAIVRGRIEEAEFGRVFEEEKVDIPKAPSLGLLLENVSAVLSCQRH